MSGRIKRGWWRVYAAFAFVSPAFGQTVFYSESSTPEKLQSKVGVGLSDDGLAVRADMTMVGQDGRTRVVPRIASKWSSFDLVDVDTALEYQDLNASGGLSRPAVDTKLRVNSTVKFIEAIEGNFRRSATKTTDTFKVAFADFDTDFSVRGGSAFNADADLVFRNAAEPASNLRTSIGLGETVDIATALRVDRDGAFGSTAKFIYRSPLAFVERLEGAVSRSVSGEVTPSLGLEFSDLVRGDPVDTSYKFKSRAVVEEMKHVGGSESLSIGVEAEFAGVRTPLGGRNALRLRVNRPLDARYTKSSSLAYDHKWSPASTSLGLNLELMRRLDDIEPSMGVTWNAQF